MNSSKIPPIKYINFDDDPIEITDAAYDQLSDQPVSLSQLPLLYVGNEEKKTDVEDKYDEEKAVPVPPSAPVLEQKIETAQLEALFKKMNIKSNTDKILLAMGTSYSLAAPFTFLNGVRLFPLLSHRLFTAVTEVFIYLCLLPKEDIEAVVYDMTTVEVEALASTFIIVLIEIATIASMLLYLSGEYLWKRAELKELNALLKELNLLKELGISNWQDLSREKIQSVITILREHGFDIERLQSVSLKNSFIRDKAENLRTFRNELHRYVNVVAVVMAVPGIYMFIKKGTSLGKKINCGLSTLAYPHCSIDKHISLLAQIVWVWMSTSFGILTYTSLGTLSYYLAPEKIASRFNRNVHQPLLKFLKLREEDKELIIYRTATWYAAYTVVMPLVAAFAAFGAIATANLYAEDTKCPNYFELISIIVTNGFFDLINLLLGTNLQIPFSKECPESEAVIELGVAIADGEIDKGYPYFQGLKFLVFLFALSIESALRRVLNPEDVKNFIRTCDRIHQESLSVALKAIGVIGLPLFFITIRFAMKILNTGRIVVKHLDSSLLDSRLQIQSNVTKEMIAENVCPANPQALIDVFNGDLPTNLSNYTLPEFINNSTIIFPISAPCPQYANMNGMTNLLMSNTLGLRVPGCPELTVASTNTAIPSTYWTGILWTLLGFYVVPYVVKSVKCGFGACRRSRERRRTEVDNNEDKAEQKQANNPNRLFAQSDVKNNPLPKNINTMQDEKQQPLLNAEQKAQESDAEVRPPSKWSLRYANISKWWNPVSGAPKATELVSTPRSGKV